MEKQERLFKLLKEEQIEHRYEPALALTSIVEPEDAIEPSRELVEDVGARGVIEPLIVQPMSNRFQIISGRRRYLAACINELESVPALITRVSPSQRDVLSIKLNRLRAENLLSDIEATERLVAKGLDDKQIGELTGLKAQEIERRKRLAVANSGIRDLLREGRCSLSVAEAAAKLPPRQQDKLVKRLAHEEVDRLTMRDVQAIKEARSEAAINALPQELFTQTFNLPVNGNGHHVETDPHQWLHRFAGQLWETFEELERSGALDLKSNKQSRRAIADARQLFAEIKQANALPDLKPPCECAQDPFDPLAKTEGDLISPAQLSRINALAKRAHLDPEALCRDAYRIGLGEMSRRAASALIEQLESRLSPMTEENEREASPERQVELKAA
ncbi:MAG: ParB/RepB/Spo0J family partition protein [Blastocatellia bacterium]